MNHPKVIQSHPLYFYNEEFYNGKKFKNFKQSIAYSSALPTIPQWMLFEHRMTPVVNFA